MVKVLYLGLFVAIICAFASSCATAGPVPSSNVHLHHKLSHLCNGSNCNHHQQQRVHRRTNQQDVALADDGTVRSERSTNLSHITGSARMIQMFVKELHLQILPDGVVNGIHNDNSEYTIMQRTTVNIGQVKIQGVATCQYLCMDSCGILYASKDFVDECVFNEKFQPNSYNTYSSVLYSKKNRTLYLALNRYGQPRRVQIHGNRQLGKLSQYVRVLTKTVNIERVKEIFRIENATSTHPLRHHGGLPTCTITVEPKTRNIDWPGVDRLRCRKRKKRKKKRRRCEKPDGTFDEDCTTPMMTMNKKKNIKNVKASDKNNKLCEPDNINIKKYQRLDGKSDVVVNNNKKKKKQRQLNANVNQNTRKKNQNYRKTLRNNSSNFNCNSNRNKIVKKVLPVFESENTTEPTASLQIGDEYAFEVTIASDSVEDLNVDESATVTSAMDDSEQIYDDGGIVPTSSTRPSGEVD